MSDHHDHQRGVDPDETVDDARIARRFAFGASFPVAVLLISQWCALHPEPAEVNQESFFVSQGYDWGAALAGSASIVLVGIIVQGVYLAFEPRPGFGKGLAVGTSVSLIINWSLCGALS